MANALNNYNPTFYANEALIQLEAAMGMANTVHRGYEQERRSFEKGDTITIRKPSTFTAQNAPSTSQDLNTEKVDITLNSWKEVKFELTDKELAYTTEQIIDEHIRPAAVALADHVDQTLAGLYTDIPWYHNVAATPTVADLTATRKVLFNNKVPMDQSRLWHMISGNYEADLSALDVFARADASAGAPTQIDGMLGRKFGMNIFANQNVQDHDTTAVTDAGAPLTDGALAVGDTSITIDDTTLTGTVKKGDIIEIDGVTQKFAVTADAAAAGNSVTVSVTPAVPVIVADGTAVTIVQSDKEENLAYHRNAFALVMVPLPETGNGAGARIATIQDPITRLSIRSRIFYDGNNSKLYVALDILYGLKTLDPNLAVRARV